MSPPIWLDAAEAARGSRSAHAALRRGWSVRQLDRQIASQFHERTALSKVGKFTHADAGQMHLYLNYARAHWTQPGENPPSA